MTGDDVSAGDHPETKPIYDLDSVQLIRMAKIMRDEGTYLSGRALTDAPSFLIGAVENPFAPPLEFRPMRLGTKIEAGAEFVQTQICFNLDKLRVFMARCGELGLLEHVIGARPGCSCRARRRARATCAIRCRGSTCPST